MRNFKNVLERVLLSIIYLFYFYREYKIRIKSLSYMFIITLVFSLVLMVANNLV